MESFAAVNLRWDITELPMTPWAHAGVAFLLFSEQKVLSFRNCEDISMSPHVVVWSLTWSLMINDLRNVLCYGQQIPDEIPDFPNWLLGPHDKVDYSGGKTWRASVQ